MRVREVKELDGAESLCRSVRAQLPETLHAIEVDLSQTEFVDSGGLGELIALHRMALQHGGGVAVRLLNPPARLQQLFELTRLHRLFQITNN